MGHANLENISQFFIRRLYAKGVLTAAECVKALIEKGEKLQASEANYSEPHMLSMGLGDVINHLHEKHSINGRSKAVAVIEAINMNEEQTKIYNQWVAGDMDLWDCGDDGNGGEYGIFDTIQWKYTTFWRTNYKYVPVLGNVTH